VTSKRAGWILSHTCLYLKQLKTGGEVVTMLVLQEDGSLTLFLSCTVNNTAYFIEYRTTHTVIDRVELQTNLLSSYLVVSMEDNSPLRR